MSESKVLTIVVPVFNEIESLPHFYERVKKVMSEIKDMQSELQFVDDGSTDGSFQWLSELVRRDPRVRVLKLSRNFGSYVALTAGLVNASGDAAAMLSADLQDPPELILELLSKWEVGFDVVWAERRSRQGDPISRRFASKVFYKIFRRIAFSDYPPKGYDFCLVDRSVIDALRSTQERNTSIFALILWSTFQSTSVSYDRISRVRGKTHWNLGKMTKLAADSIISFSNLPIRFGLIAAIAVGTGLFAYMGFIIYSKLTGHFDFPAGWSSTMTVILFTSGLQLTVLAILGEYLWRALDQTRGRPLYVISRRLGYGEKSFRPSPEVQV